MTSLERVRGLAGTLWVLSWFELYLEIFRFQHVALPWPANTAGVPVFGPTSHAGWWLRADLGCAVVAPAIYIIVTTFHRRERQANSATIFSAVGALVATLGLINQIIWRPRFVVDLTLRTGNGGFVVIGLASALLAAALSRRRSRTR